MITNITARHCEISEELRQRAATVLGRFGGLVNRAVEGAVIFDVVAGISTAEIRLTGGGVAFVAKGEEKDHRTALDRAEDKVRRQFDKTVQIRRGRSAKGAA